MSLILRNVKGSPLTYTEMDNNLVYLEGLGITGSTNGLSSVLANNNSTGTYSIEMSNSTTIDAANGGGQLDLRYGGNDDDVMLSNDGGAFGDSQLNLTTGYVELSCYGTSSIISGLELDPESNSNGTRLYKEDTSSGAKTNLEINTSFGEIRSEAGSGDYEVLINVDGSTGLASLITYDYAGDRVDALELDPTLTNLGTRLYSEDTNSGDISEVKLEPTQIILESQATIKGNIYSSRIENIIGNIDIICENQTSGEVGSVLLNASGEVLIVGNDGIDTSSIFVGGVNISIETVELLLPLISTYADNAAAISGGLVADTVYKTATGELRIVI